MHFLDDINPLPNIQSILIALCIGMLAGSVASWLIQGWRIDSIRADYETDKNEAITHERERADQIGNDYAIVVRWLNEQKRARTVTLVKELEKPIYRDAACVLPESGRLLVNDAVRQANAARLGDPVLPGTAGGQGIRNDGRSIDVVGLVSRGLRGMLGWQSQADPVGDGQ